MFNLSVKSTYALLALLELALNYNKKSHIQIKDIAESQKIPINYLEQLLLILKKSGFVKSIRGKEGGYTLDMPPHKIKLIDVLQTLEGELKILPEKKEHDFFNFFFNSLEDKIKIELNITLEELLLKKERYEKNFLYVI